MSRLLPITCCVLSLVLGVSIGWRFGHVTLLPEQRKRLEEYRQVKATFGMSEKDMAKLEGYLPQMRKDLARTDEFAAGVALSALTSLERGDAERARKVLSQTISMYYRAHRDDGNTNVLAHINQFAATNAALSNAIHRKLD